jgi:hypothetical protein
MNKSINKIANSMADVLLQFFKPDEAIMVLSVAKQAIKAEIVKDEVQK